MATVRREREAVIDTSSLLNLLVLQYVRSTGAGERIVIRYVVISTSLDTICRGNSIGETSVRFHLSSIDSAPSSAFGP